MMMDSVLLQLGVGGIFCVMLLDRIFNFLNRQQAASKAKRDGKSECGPVLDGVCAFDLTNRERLLSIEKHQVPALVEQLKSITQVATQQVEATRALTQTYKEVLQEMRELLRDLREEARYADRDSKQRRGQAAGTAPVAYAQPPKTGG